MKRVLITGVSKGIGRALAEVFLKNNFFVIGVGKTKPEFDYKNFHFIYNDFENFKDFSIDFPLNIVVLNSGIAIYKKLKDASLNDFEKIFKINMCGNLLTLKSVLGNLEKDGLVSFVSSIATLNENNFENWGLYSSSKIASEKALKVFAAEEDLKLLIFNIGRVDTDIWKSVKGKEANLPKMNRLAVAKQMFNEIMSALNNNDFSFKQVIID
ncbi:short chain dehydrogenase [Thermotomaculum hydrothermale]|uniref:Short chain dehydrogenase n=1 Tax=Thermotomaculum hydrothermale TaxID=981385 RepID=A0A7R6PGR2_9BACT|nr:SDR family NAD(P)-dependent oxidoreductase [Thermotomaculum hydrothermale]BBB33424.1 short chain dehydrogenase [Thermotomaculum hydrothermale]